MLLYRYLSAEYALKSLQQNQFRVSQLSALNDVFDCNLAFVPEDPDGEMVRMFDSFHNTFFGVLCFSRERDNLLLWAHYSSGYSGIALGFDRDVLKSYNSFEDLKTVDYSSDERPSFAAHNPKGLDPYDRVIELFSRKGSKWSYEAEERLFMQLRECQVEGTEYFTELPTDSLNQIVLGPKCELSKDLIKRSACRGGFPENIRILKAVPSRTRFELEFVENWL